MKKMKKNKIKNNNKPLFHRVSGIASWSHGCIDITAGHDVKQGMCKKSCSKLHAHVHLRQPQDRLTRTKIQQQSSSFSSKRFCWTRRFDPETRAFFGIIIPEESPSFRVETACSTKTFAGKRRTLLLNVKPARMSVKRTKITTRSSTRPLSCFLRQYGALASDREQFHFRIFF